MTPGVRPVAPTEPSGRASPRPPAAAGMPWPVASSEPAWSVTRDPAGIGQGAVVHVEVVRGPRKGTVVVPTVLEIPSVVANGTAVTSGTFRTTSVRPVTFSPETTAAYFVSNVALGF